jgi:hypothetical protein
LRSTGIDIPIDQSAPVTTPRAFQLQPHRLIYTTLQCSVLAIRFVVRNSNKILSLMTCSCLPFGYLYIRLGLRVLEPKLVLGRGYWIHVDLRLRLALRQRLLQLWLWLALRQRLHAAAEGLRLLKLRLRLAQRQRLLAVGVMVAEPGGLLSLSLTIGGQYCSGQ